MAALGTQTFIVAQWIFPDNKRARSLACIATMPAIAAWPIAWRFWESLKDGRWFVAGKESGAEPNLSETLREIGQDPDRVIEAANAESVGRAYDDNTREARRLNIFGAPTFIVRGVDRNDHAVKPAQSKPKSPLFAPLVAVCAINAFGEGPGPDGPF